MKTIRLAPDRGNAMRKQTMAIFAAGIFFAGLGLAGEAFAKPVSEATRKKMRQRV
jgi:hypothetical protein